MPTRHLIDAPQVERFRADLARLGVAPIASKPLGLAVSGGADSLALLLLAQAAHPRAVVAATVDHQLRAEAAEEARQVAVVCRQLDVPHTSLRPDPARFIRLPNIQDRARHIRYAALSQWAGEAGVGFVAIGHQRDDVAETFLMRAGRGAGATGLAAMRRLRPLNGFADPISLIRPLLNWSRAELADIASAAGLSPAVDPTNDDTRYERARARRLLAATPALLPDRLAFCAQAIRDAEDALEWLVNRERTERFEEGSENDWWLRADDLPFEVKRRLVILAIERARNDNGLFDSWRATAVPQLVRALDEGRGGTVGNVQARRRQGRWHFRLAPPRSTR